MLMKKYKNPKYFEVSRIVLAVLKGSRKHTSSTKKSNLVSSSKIVIREWWPGKNNLNDPSTTDINFWI